MANCAGRAPLLALTAWTGLNRGPQGAWILMQATSPMRTRPRGALWDLLTFDRLITGPLVHLIYWAGLLLISLFAFGTGGAAVGVAIRAGAFEGALLAFPLLVVGLLVSACLALIWRGMCEFYVAIFRIAEDLRELRVNTEPPAAG